VFQGFVSQLMMLSEGWDSAVPVPEARNPNGTFNSTLAAAAGGFGTPLYYFEMGVQ